MKTVLVTGASSGMGKATAERLLADGYVVYAAARRVDRMRDLEDLGATVLAMDITKDDDIVAAVDRITAERGGVDVLVNNAGFGMYGAMEDTTIADARYQFEVNLFGLARLTQLALPAMRAKGAGKIVNLSSMGGRIYTPLGSWYHATKHAVEGWSDCLRLELKPFGIDVIVIEPGIIETEFGHVLVEPMLERSGKGPYADLAHKVAGTTRESYEAGGSPASLIAGVIAGALEARRPKTRYVAGKYARLLITVRKLFGDRVYDRVIMAQL
ncbi:oxidoreductase [Kribbella sp. VKM Ac-2568]|uniref:oxidoreductase n=1 Tax=Kribbella sp. VKM Ac-2568 TaxID=2512219 RepID=UPI0010EA94FA|nr:oxidoreductase [Kribbella sp. VKM Ac-2568]TCM45014.1 short-subunit dehydrogenase [Kribbella sp. VKM Ac-2568]